MSDAAPMEDLGPLYHHEVATEGQILLHLTMPKEPLPTHRTELAHILRNLADKVEDGTFPN